MKPAAPKTIPRRAPAVRFAAEIAQAQAEGFAPEAMALRLTLGDATLLKRDPSVALADISFAGGVMRYLGVRIVEGGVGASVLDRDPAPEVEAPPEPPPKKKRATKAKAAAAVA